MKYKRLMQYPQVEGPQLVRAHPFDAGADIRSAEDYIIRGKESVVVQTGIAVEIPRGYEGQIRSRSGMAFRNDVVAFHGTVDAGFVGHLQVKIFNYGFEPYKINKGDKVAQLVIAEVELPTFEEVTEFTIDERNNEMIQRGTNGFGSTGQ